MRLAPNSFSILYRDEQFILVEQASGSEYYMERFSPDQHTQFINRVKELGKNWEPYCVVGNYRIILRPVNSTHRNHSSGYEFSSNSLGKIVSNWLTKYKFNEYSVFCRTTARGNSPLDKEFKRQNNNVGIAKVYLIILFVCIFVPLAIYLLFYSGSGLSIIIGIICFIVVGLFFR